MSPPDDVHEAHDEGEGFEGEARSPAAGHLADILSDAVELEPYLITEIACIGATLLSHGSFDAKEHGLERLHILTKLLLAERGPREGEGGRVLCETCETELCGENEDENKGNKHNPN